MAGANGGAERYWRLTLACLAGPLLWAVHFAAVYGGAHFACHLLAQPAAEALIHWLVVLATLIIGGILAVLLRAGWFAPLDPQGEVDADNKRFMEYTARGLAMLSLFGVVWAGLAVFVVPPCVGT